MGVVPGQAAVVIAGGDPPDLHAARRIPRGAYVIAADSGLDHATALGIAVDRVVGDLDSVTPAALAAARAAGVRVEQHPAAKDASDLELALDAALAHGADRLIVLGGWTGRLDHLLATALLLAGPSYANVEVSARLGTATVRVVRRQAALAGRPGDLLSLLPVHGPARRVRTTGLRFPLRGEDLHPGSSRGLSNEFTEPAARVSLDAGVLLAIQPEESR